ncbi:hypothetical protein BVC80_1739g23 [Macleaya cordata]|uniref:Uncharacterized protein n=1 Tax=Macleaya cordata TaxID=56857 RepID=A0A200Q7T3_MACCD|nr:hypothetical protein BVC80_1739g23 [Macleaya cordata]
MVLSEEWEKIKSGSSTSNFQHQDVKNTILNEDFWHKTKTILSFVKPIWEMIRFCDSDKAVMGEVYQMMEDMLGSIKEELSNDFDLYHLVEGFVLQRWEKMNLPLHSLAYVLTPFYYSQAWLTSLGPGRERRKKPHADHHIGILYLDVVDRIVKDPREQSNKGIFGRPHEAIQDRESLSSMQWWDLYGVAAPELYAVANWDLFADDDNLDNNTEAIEDRDHRLLHEARDSHDGRPSFARSSLPTQGSTHESSLVQEERREARAKRPHRERSEGTLSLGIFRIRRSDAPAPHSGYLERDHPVAAINRH